jgi:glycosyltransferase involved in cell wall biosynthesis
MNIVYVTNRYYPGLGGAEIHIRMNAEGLVKQGHSATIITSDFLNFDGNQKVNIPEEIINGVKVIRLKSFRIFGKDALTIFPKIFTMSKFLNEFDVIHTITFGYFTTWSCALLKLFGFIKKPIVYSPHYAPIKTYPALLVALYEKTLGTLTVRTAKIVVLLTKAYQKFFEKLGAKKTIIVPPVVTMIPEVSSETKDDLRRQLNITPDQKVIVSISRVVYSKGIHYFVHALSEILKKEPNAVLIIAGKGEYLPEIQKLADSLGVSKNIRYAGAISDDTKVSLLNIADLFFLLSFSGESFGIAAVEAMSIGLPVLGSNRGAIPYVVQDRINGLIVDPENTQEVAAKTLELLQTKQNYYKQNKEYAKEFAEENVVKKLIELYSTAITA